MFPSEMVVMDQNGVIRTVIEFDETEEDVAMEVRRLAQQIYRGLNPELFPPEDSSPVPEESAPAPRAIDSLTLLEPPAGHVTVLSRTRIGVPGPPIEPKPQPPPAPPTLRPPSTLPPRMRFFQETGRHTRVDRMTPVVEETWPAESFSFLPDSAYGAPPSEEEPEAEPMNHSTRDYSRGSSTDYR